MAVSSHLSVQAIRGRFEQFRSDGTDLPNSSPTLYRKGRSPLNSAEYGPPQDDSPPLLPTEDAIERSRDTTPSPVKDSRLRSYSVGNLQPLSYHDSKISSKNSLTRNHSYGLNNYSNENINCNSNTITKSPSDTFNSFSEKQKLVESIVMNIKKSAANAKSKEFEHKNKDFRPFSKFEKDLKNVLERGVRRKWNSKGMKDEKFLKETNFENHESKFSKERILDHQSFPEQKTSLSKINSSLGVELYSTNSRVHEESDHKNYQPCQIKYNNDTGKPPVPTISNSITKLKQELISSKQNVESSQYDTCASCISPYPTEKLCESVVKRCVEFPNNAPDCVDKSSPVRPPRRRRMKKDKAPMPPSSPAKVDVKVTNQNTEKPHRENDPQTNSILDHFNTSDESSHYSLNLDSRRRSAGELSRDFNYEERYEKNLERERALSNRENTDDVFSDNCSSSNKDIEPFCRNSMSKSESDICTSLPPTGSPPKKPPRTFAYDIYLSLKPEHKDSHPRSGSVPKLSSAELDSLYTKPLKRLKDKQTSPSYLPTSKRTDFRGSKPAVAPKPIDIIAKAKKRLSVTEPLPSTADSKEFSGHTPSVKRNSSFRFSFRKHKKNSGSSPSHATIKKESQVGRRLRIATKNLNSKKMENEKRVRFQTENEEEDTVYNDTRGEGPIYATPFSKKQLPQDDQKELHYMCSPLFNNGNEYANQTPAVPNSSPTEIRNNSSGTLRRELPAPPGTPPPMNDASKERLGIMEELRQSCRFVQKRLKGVTQKEMR